LPSFLARGRIACRREGVMGLWRRLADLLASPPPVDLTTLAQRHGTDKTGAHWYTQHYEHYLAPFRHRDVNLLEIGVGGYEDTKAGGKSLRMWRDYFPNGRIYGIDVYDKSALQDDRIRIWQGNQSDETFLRGVVAEIGRLDIVIDDGSHVNADVIKSFSVLFPLLDQHGIYVAEDVQTSYWSGFGGTSEDLDSKTTTMGFFKALTDSLNYEEVVRPGYQPSYYDQNITGIYFHHNLIIIQKGINKEGSNTLVDNTAPAWILKQ
jgi:hypothetical protein